MRVENIPLNTLLERQRTLDGGSLEGSSERKGLMRNRRLEINLVDFYLFIDNLFIYLLNFIYFFFLIF